MIWRGQGLSIVSQTVTLHPFKAWLRNNQLTQEWAATELELSRLTLFRNFRGDRVMDIEVKLKVERLTAGSVSALEICQWEIGRRQNCVAGVAA